MRNAFRLIAFWTAAVPAGAPHSKKAFTLIELLVVITIIVVLLTLLAPAMERAVYFAELAKCSAKLDMLASQLHLYALDHKRFYPYREGPAHIAGWAPNQVANREYDDRPVFSRAAKVNLLNDPMCRPVNLETTQAASLIYAHYSIWYGMRHGAGQTDMYKLGDRWTYKDADSDAVITFNVLITDTDGVRPGFTDALSSHPDRDGVAVLDYYQDVSNAFIPLFGGGSASLYGTLSSWHQRPHTRLPLDLNFAHDDGAVTRYHGVLYDDPRMAKRYYSRAPASEHYVNLPR